MVVPRMAGHAADDPIDAAGRLFCRHQRDLRLGASRCQVCGGRWLRKAVDGHLVDGCVTRQLAAVALVLSVLSRSIAPERA